MLKKGDHVRIKPEGSRSDPSYWWGIAAKGKTWIVEAVDGEKVKLLNIPIWWPADKIERIKK